MRGGGVVRWGMPRTPEVTGGDSRRVGGCSAAGRAADLESQLREFLTYYNATMAHPFAWTYTGKPLQKERRPQFVAPHRRVKLNKPRELRDLATSCVAV